MYYTVTNLTTTTLHIAGIVLAPSEAKNVVAATVQTNWSTFAAFVDNSLITIESEGYDVETIEDTTDDTGGTFDILRVDFDSHTNSAVALEVNHGRGKFPIVQVYGKEPGGELVQLPDAGSFWAGGSGFLADIFCNTLDEVHVYTDAEEGVIVLLF